jgi:hypothetical protein
LPNADLASSAFRRPHSLAKPVAGHVGFRGLQRQDRARRVSGRPQNLSIVAIPSQCAPDCDTGESKTRAIEEAAQADDFARGNPSAAVVRLPYADHFIWRSNERDVEREMNAFMDKLDRQ